MSLNSSIKSIIVKQESDLSFVATEIKEIMRLPSLILLSGTLGTGKTTFCKYLLSQYGINPTQVKSPTYSLINNFLVNELQINHLDLYRLEKADEILTLEIQELLQNPQSFTLIEWAERINIQQIQQPNLQIIKVNFTILENNWRQITIENLPNSL